jgi:hypothetical protein
LLRPLTATRPGTGAPEFDTPTEIRNERICHTMAGLIEEEIVPKGTSGLSAQRLRDLARSGAEVVLNQLRAEIIAIERTFPELALPNKRRAVRQAFEKARKRVRTMTEAEKKAVSDRMKKYWAERRKAKAKVK